MSLFRVVLMFMMFVIFSCEQEKVDESKRKLTRSQQTVIEVLTDVKRNSKFDKILSKYFYNSHEIFNGENYIFYAKIYEDFFWDLKNFQQPLGIYWNEKIRDVEYFGWGYDTTYCGENLLILLGDNPREADYNCFCFTEDGYVYSLMPIYNPNTDQTDWLR